MTEPSSRPDKPSILSWILIPLAFFPALALFTYDWRSQAALQTPPVASANWIGALGDGFAYYGYLLLGLAVWAIPAYCAFAVIVRLTGHRVFSWVRVAWTVVGLVAIASLVQMLEGHAPGLDAMKAHANIAATGGVVGHLAMTCLLEPLIGRFGAGILTGALLGLSLIATIGLTNIGRFFVGLFRWASAPEGEAYAGADAAAGSADAAAGSDLFGETPGLTEKERRKLEKQQAKEAKRAQREAAAQAKRDAQQRVEQDRQAEIDALNAARESVRQSRQQAAKGGGDAAGAAAGAVRKRAAGAAKGGAAAKPEAAAAEASPAEDKGPYILPPVTLLAPVKTTVADHGDVDETTQRMIDTLKLFGVNATVSYTVPGPVVTKYALELEPGTKYSSVTNLQSELMGALRAKSIRVEAPIPGEDRVGIEVPNRAPAGISFREIFESEAWKGARAELPLLFGKRADGKELIADLASMPHMLVAGATGQGKSVCLNSLISGLLMTRTPEQMKLIMVDPKCVEFTPYASVPHLLVPVITDNKKVVFSLHWAVAEMEKRLKLFARAHVKNIYDFNHRKTFTQTEMFGGDTAVGSDMPKSVPYIIIIIDEAADLIGQCGKDVNPDIQRITQKARAAGIHLILATQRPDAKIITGAIKANIPGRVAFKTASSVDSRTILDDTGAENLIGKGDMLFRGKDGMLIRAQGAWISDEEIANITHFIEQHANTQFDDRFTKKLSTIKEEEVDIYAEDDDGEATKEAARAQKLQVKAAADADDFKKAVECVINTKRASTSHFQRQLGWGYNHAAKILDELARRGIVSEQQGIGPRSIIMDQDQLLAILNGGDAAGVAAAVAGGEGGGGDTGEDLTTTTQAGEGGDDLFAGTEEQTA